MCFEVKSETLDTFSIVFLSMATTVNMDETKRSRDDTIDQNKRTKLEGTRCSILLNLLDSFFLPETTITLFEDLSNEIIYTIFESFD